MTDLVQVISRARRGLRTPELIPALAQEMKNGKVLHDRKKPKKVKRMATATMERKKRIKPAPVIPEQKPGGRRERIHLKQLERHPDNREPTEAAIKAVADSMASEGQLEPLIVRVISAPDEFRNFPTYQIVSGETRWRAARLLNWSELDCEIRELDDAAALRVLAAANATRQDLNPIDQAKLIERLCQPVEKGGSGLTRADAAKMFDLQSGGAASNLVRLLELPEVWQARVASGELPQSYARELLPLVALGEESEAWADLEKEWDERDSDYSELQTRADMKRMVRHWIEECTRPFEDGDKQLVRDENRYYGEHPLRFRPSPEVERELRVVEVEIEGKPRRRATNCKLYDSFQLPQVKAHVAKQRAKWGLKDDDEPKSPEKKLSPKQQLAEDARRKEEAKVLANRVGRWRAAWLRELVAEQIVLEANGDLAIRIALWQQERLKASYTFSTRDLEPGEALEGIWKVKDAWKGVLSLKGCEGAGALVAYWLRVPGRDGYLHPMPDEQVEDLVELLKIDLAEAWKAMPSSLDRIERMQNFLELHTCEQLDKLGDELGVHVREASAKAAKVKLIRTSPRVLKLPKCLAPKRKAVRT